MTHGSATRRLDIPAGDGLSLHTEVSGSGSPLVMLHGFTGDISTMDGLSQRLSSGHLVVVPDMIGHGRSDIPELVEFYEVGAMARQVEAVADHFGLDDFHLVGYSMGGRVALTLACGSPHRVRSLCLVGASAGIATEAERAQRRVDDEALAVRIENGGLEPFVDDWMAKPLFASQAALGPDHLEEARRQRLSNSPSGLARSLRGGGTGTMPPLHDRLPDCDVAAMLIAGDGDEKFRKIADQLAHRLPNAVTAVVPGAGHAAHLERPDLVAEIISAHTTKADVS